MKIAAYIAGNKNIVKSSIIVFQSLQMFESDIDCFLFLDDLHISKQEHIEIEKNNIFLEKLPKDNLFTGSLSWPKEVFLNFLAPTILYQKGYDACIKLDHDILVIGPLDINNNFPVNKIFSLIEHNFETLSDSVLKDYDFFKNEFKISSYKKKSVMFGNVIINLKKYVEFDFWDKFKNAFETVITKSPSKSSDSFFADMGLFNLVLVKYKIKYKSMDVKYNTIASHQHVVNKKNLNIDDIRLIHYAGPKKPWCFFWFKWLTNPYFYYLRQLWIDFVERNTNFNKKLKFVSVKKDKKSILSKIVFSKYYRAYVKLFIRYF